MLKASINKLRLSVKGIYNVYNLTEEELRSLKQHFGNKVQGSNGNYTISENVNRRLFVEVFVHEMWTPVKFDIYDDISKLLQSTKISEEMVKKLSNQLKGTQIYVSYDWVRGSWSIENYNVFLEQLKNYLLQ